MCQRNILLHNILITRCSHYNKKLSRFISDGGTNFLAASFQCHCSQSSSAGSSRALTTSHTVFPQSKDVIEGLSKLHFAHLFGRCSRCRSGRFRCHKPHWFPKLSLLSNQTHRCTAAKCFIFSLYCAIWCTFLITHFYKLYLLSHQTTIF